MHKYLIWSLFIWATPLALNAQTYNYAPNLLNIPCLEQKGDGAVGLAWGRGSRFQSAELDATYSPLPYLAVMVNYFGALEKQVRKMEDVGTNYYLMEGAVGAYEALPKGSASVFAGFGAGNLFSNFGGDNLAEFEIRRWFIQPGITYSSNFFQAGVALRLTRLVYHHGDVSFSIDPSYLSAIQKIEQQSPLFLPEIGLQAGIKLKPVLINIHIASIFPNTSDWDFERLNTALSLFVEFGAKKKHP